MKSLANLQLIIQSLQNMNNTNQQEVLQVLKMDAIQAKIFLICIRSSQVKIQISIHNQNIIKEGENITELKMSLDNLEECKGVVYKMMKILLMMEIWRTKVLRPDSIVESFTTTIQQALQYNQSIQVLPKLEIVLIVTIIIIPDKTIHHKQISQFKH